ncbi:MAG TPA: glucose-6-phosphate dehydrogenase, partial [Dermatophilaceae bacterium]
MSPAAVARGQNPLRSPQDKRLPRIAGPCSLVLFGVTGDLARNKIMPAIYDLANRGLLPPSFSLVGFARRDWTQADFAKVVRESVRAHARTPFHHGVWRNLAEGFRFVSGTFDDPGAFDVLRETLHSLSEERGTAGNYIFYLSIPPASFSTVTQQLDRSGLSRTGVAEEPQSTWRRVVIEKPFGHDLASARELNAVVGGVFSS